MNGDVRGFGMIEGTRTLYKTRGGASGHAEQYRICLPWDLIPCCWKSKDKIRIKRVEIDGEDVLILRKKTRKCSTTNKGGRT